MNGINQLPARMSAHELRWLRRLRWLYWVQIVTFPVQIGVAGWHENSPALVASVMLFSWSLTFLLIANGKLKGSARARDLK